MIRIAILASLLLISIATLAAPEGFNKGPLFENYGENTAIEGGLLDPQAQRFKVIFDISKQNQTDGPNRQFNSVARFINMHARAGVPKDNIEVAMVIHGKASFDLMNNAAHSAKFEKPNNNTELINLLSEFGVQIFICGQSASFHGLTNTELNQNVEMSLSAMTANALLQQRGYTLNPF
ncbi:MAG: intracellular sulfur oxidation DsrE/DsrF family protein [Arenicella sp.]|jgi:intracellular sulfur oxidation DsrE/DsrF family protein